MVPAAAVGVADRGQERDRVRDVLEHVPEDDRGRADADVRPEELRADARVAALVGGVEADRVDSARPEDLEEPPLPAAHLDDCAAVHRRGHLVGHRFEVPPERSAVGLLVLVARVVDDL